MKRKAISLVTAVLTAILITTTVFAGKISMSGSFTLQNSVHFDGFATGLGKTDYLVEMTASGNALVVCTNYGSNDVPGQSYPKVSGKDAETLPGNDPLTKNGKAPVSLAVRPDVELNPIIPWNEGGCPNSNWTARVFFIDWQEITLDVKDSSGQVVLQQYNYTCNTTYIPQNDDFSFDDGTIECSLIK